MKFLKKAANSVPMAPAIAAMFAAAAAALVAGMPHWLFEYYVQRLGLPALIPAAAPPLGYTARIASALAAFLLWGALLWLLFSLIEKRLFGKPVRRPARPVVTAGPPVPVSAEAELGAPLMSDAAMTQAREELMLETAMIEEAAPLPEAEIAELELVETVPGPAPEPEPVLAAMPPVETFAAPPPVATPPAAPVSRLPVAPESLAGLLKRLDSALLDKPAGWKPARAAR